VPRTCAQQGFNCGQQGDGCGGTHDCGTCTLPQTCGGGGRPGVCGGGPLQYFGYLPGQGGAAGPISEQGGPGKGTNGPQLEWNFICSCIMGLEGVALAEAAGVKMIMWLPDADDPGVHWNEWVAALRPHVANLVAFLVQDEPDAYAFSRGIPWPVYKADL